MFELLVGSGLTEAAPACCPMSPRMRAAVGRPAAVVLSPLDWQVQLAGKGEIKATDGTSVFGILILEEFIISLQLVWKEINCPNMLCVWEKRKREFYLKVLLSKSSSQPVHQNSKGLIKLNSDFTSLFNNLKGKNSHCRSGRNTNSPTNSSLNWRDYDVTTTHAAFCGGNGPARTITFRN